jgi:dihydroorotate dehydrogenase
LLKIAPDLNEDQIADIAAIARETSIDGLIATNTTIRRDHLRTSQSELQKIGDGGLSGSPLTEMSRRVVSQLFRLTDGQIPIVGAGGIMNGEDAWQMICHGASLVQVYTGFIYGGPMFVKRVNRHIAQRLHESSMSSVAEAVGSRHR